MKRILLVVIVAMSIRLAPGAETPALIERPASENGPTQVSVGIWIVDIDKIDSAEQSFTAEVAVVLRWKDSRLAHTGSGVVRYPLEQVCIRALASPTRPPPSFTKFLTLSK
jgi:hypothetical protein